MNQGHAEPESQFHYAVTRVSVAQICQTVGYQKTQNCALENLSDMVGRYIRAIADSAVASANSGGRTECNLVDVIMALEDLGSVQGFSGAYKLEESHCLMSSSAFKEIMGFVYWKKECPFAQPIPNKILPEVKRSGNQMGLCHVPRWLPEMPEIIDTGGLGLETKSRAELIWEEASGEKFAERESKLRKEWNEKGKGFELPEKRMRVKFKMGMVTGMVASVVENKSFGMHMGMRNSGVLSRSGNGKRIICQGWSNGGNGNEE